MKDIYKNPTLYYILVPTVLALWPLCVWLLYLPDAERRWDKEQEQYEESQETVKDILFLDPDRLKLTDLQDAAAEFDYSNAVDKVADLYGITPANYDLRSGPVIKPKKGQKSQDASINLKKVDITKLAQFLSTIQLRWANLQCVRLKMTASKGLRDKWDVDLKFKYYY